CLLYYIRARVF
nr:immunoglobulin light chain junction region [Macaca mulatta]